MTGNTEGYFCQASKEVVKQIGHTSLHSVPDLHSAPRYRLYQIIKIKRSRKPCTKPVYLSLNLALDQALPDIAESWAEVSNVPDVSYEQPHVPTPENGHCSEESPASTSSTCERIRDWCCCKNRTQRYKELASDVVLVDEGESVGKPAPMTLEQMFSTEAPEVAFKAVQFSKTFDHVTIGGKVVYTVGVRGGVKIDKKSKCVCDLGPLQKYEVPDLSELQRSVKGRCIDLGDSTTASIKDTMNDYNNENKLHTLSLVTSIYKLTQDGHITQRAETGIAGNASAAVAPDGVGIAGADAAVTHVQRDESHVVLKIPKGTIMAYEVNELVLDSAGRVRIITENRSGEFVKDLNRSENGANQECYTDADSDNFPREEDIHEYINEDMRGVFRALLQSCDLTTICALNQLLEDEEEPLDIDTSDFADNTKRLLHEMGAVEASENRMTLDPLSSLSEKSGVLSMIIGAIDQLWHTQLDAIMKLTESEAIALVDKVLKNKLFAKPVIAQLPTELNTPCGVALLRELNFEMKGTGCELMEHKAEIVHGEFLAARAVIKTLYDIPAESSQDVPITWQRQRRISMEGPILEING